MKKVVIIGNGIAGVTAARNIRKNSNFEITMISEETEYFFSRTALMYIYMGHMKFEHTKPYEDFFWKKNNINLKFGKVQQIDFNAKTLNFNDNTSLEYDILILATGSKSNKFGWEGQELQGVQGLYSIQDLELMEVNTAKIQKAVVVGGGLIGIEMVEMLKSRNIEVVYLVREKHFWDMVLPETQAQIIDQLILEHHVDLKLETQLKKIVGDNYNNVVGIYTDKDEFVECQFVGLTVGVSPNIDFVKNTPLKTDRGILVDEYLKTNIENVYAIGDCVQLIKPQQNRKSIEAVWYIGKKMGEIVAQTITSKDTLYQQDFWYNSAKFFDLEYQTYGTVSAKPIENEKHFVWISDDNKLSVLIAYDKNNLNVLGVNTLGIRMRQVVWQEWISKKQKLDFVIKNLKIANFDPEFYKSYEKSILRKFLSNEAKINA